MQKENKEYWGIQIGPKSGQSQQNKILQKVTAATWEAALDTLLDSGLLDEIEVPFFAENEVRHIEFSAFNLKVRNIRAYINQIK